VPQNAKIGPRFLAVFHTFGSTKIGPRFLSDNLDKFNFFTIFRFELGLGVNMKVLGMEVSFLMALV